LLRSPLEIGHQGAEIVDPFALSPADARARLCRIIRTESIRRGEFVLASGRRSDVYVDLRRTTTHPEGAALVGRLVLDLLDDTRVELVGGPTLGADPIVGAVAALSASRPRAFPVFIVRKSAKAHGTGAAIEGQFRAGARVAILDDTVTGGGSILHAVRTAREAGAIVDEVLTIVDRNEGGREAISAEGHTLRSLFTLEDVLDGTGT
jgi:orotate phosphoribosyltransferase